MDFGTFLLKHLTAECQKALCYMFVRFHNMPVGLVLRATFFKCSKILKTSQIHYSIQTFMKNVIKFSIFNCLWKG